MLTLLGIAAVGFVVACAILTYLCDDMERAETHDHSRHFPPYDRSDEA